MSEPVTFFDHQDHAMRRSRWALAGFAITVLAVTVSVTLLADMLYRYGLAESPQEVDPSTLQTLWVAASIGTLVVILLSWAYRRWTLSGGAEAVMKSMGGRWLSADTADPGEKRLLNLVEEMSIASGIPVPEVYVLDSGGINACATGLEIDQAAVAVTRGALERLDRDELQGILAHEFSHILHGDMALNTQLIAWLAGLFTISEIGRWLLYLNLGGGSRHSRGGKNDRGAPQIALFGAGLWLAGSLGVLFGKLLQARLSREREFLADASAVQFTRNPQGIGNALRKLGSKGLRGRMARPNSDCAHMMLSPLRASSFTRLWATHPPLPSRIQRVMPEWDGTWLDAPPPNPSVYTQSSPEPARPSGPRIHPAAGTAMLAGLFERLHAPNEDRMRAARAWREDLPAAYVEAAHSPENAPLLVFHLLLPGGHPLPSRLTDALPPERLESLQNLREQPAPAPGDRLPLLDMALPALRQMPRDRHDPFLSIVDDLIEADGQVDLFEYALRRIVVNTLEDTGNARRPSRNRTYIGKAVPALSVMFSILSRVGAEDEEAVRAAFQKARDYMTGYTAGKTLELLPPEECGLEDMDRACELLANLAPKLQQRALAAALATISADERLTSTEVEATRAFAAAMRVPVPPHLGFGAEQDS